MNVIVVLLSIAATLLIGAIPASALLRESMHARGNFALLLGVAYPLGALMLAMWMHAIAFIGIGSTFFSAVVPIVAVIVFIAIKHWAIVRAALHRIGAFIAGRFIDTHLRWLWLALLVWLALRLSMLAITLLAQPPLPWEAWLHAVSRARVWSALHAPGTFVMADGWGNPGAYLSTFSGASAFTPAIDVWTILVTGGFDDTIVHAPWLFLWLSLPLLTYGALREANVTPIAALAGACVTASLPLINAHAALGGTAAMLFTAFLFAAFVFAWRQTRSRMRGDTWLCVAMIVGLIATGAAIGALWCVALLPFACMRFAPTTQRKALAAMLAVGVAATIVVAQNRFALSPLQDSAAPGLAALAQHTFLLGNWHLLPWAALAFVALGFRQWRDADWLPATIGVALGALIVIVLTTSPLSRLLMAATGSIGQAAMPLAPLLAMWSMWIAHAYWLDTRVIDTASDMHVDRQSEAAQAPADVSV
ncbi:MAG TPA: hypothetical protein VNG69_04805 [Casimicrobiaceae bacterium]|nr:hypothetical protein [Casimicrobiaceae bacterium]